MIFAIYLALSFGIASVLTKQYFGGYNVVNDEMTPWLFFLAAFVAWPWWTLVVIKEAIWK